MLRLVVRVSFVLLFGFACAGDGDGDGIPDGSDRCPRSPVGRSIDEDHYGAGFGFRFGSPDEPICKRYIELLSKRLGREPEGFLAVGDVSEIMALLHDFRAAGVHKFILRPVASDGEDFIDQTRLFVEKLLPEIRALNH